MHVLFKSKVKCLRVSGTRSGVANRIDRTTFLEHTTVVVRVLGTMTILYFPTLPSGMSLAPSLVSLFCSANIEIVRHLSHWVASVQEDQEVCSAEDAEALYLKNMVA